MFEITPWQQQPQPPAEPDISGLLGTVWNVLSGSVRAWCAETDAKTTVRILSAREQVIGAQSRLIQTELTARRDALRLTQEIEHEATELTFWRTLQTIPEEHRISFLERETATQALLAERDQLRRARLTGQPRASVAPLPAPAAIPLALPEPAVQPYMSDQTIESLAMKAVTKLGHLTGPAATQAWGAWKAELHRRYDQNIALEIETRVEQLREVADLD